MVVRAPHLDLEVAMGKASQASTRAVLTTKEERTLLRSGAAEVCMLGAPYFKSALLICLLQDQICQFVPKQMYG